MLYFDILDDDRADRNAKDAYICILRHADIYERTEQTKTRAELAAVMSMSVDSFDRGVKTLIALGYAEMEQRIKPGTKSRAPSLYTLYDSRASRLERDLDRQGESRSVSEAGEPQEPSRDEPPNDIRNGRAAGQGYRTQRSPQTHTTRALAADSGNPCRCVRQALPQGAVTLTAGSGSNTYKREEERREKREEPPVLAVGVVTVRTPREDREAPPAKNSDHERAAGEVLGQLPEHYHRAPGWLRTRLLRRIADALGQGHAAAALIAYAHRFVADPNFGTYEHLRRFDDVVRKLAADVADGTACAACGRDPEHAWCEAGPIPAPALPEPSQAVTASDRA